MKTFKNTLVLFVFIFTINSIAAVPSIILTSSDIQKFNEIITYDLNTVNLVDSIEKYNKINIVSNNNIYEVSYKNHNGNKYFKTTPSPQILWVDVVSSINQNNGGITYTTGEFIGDWPVELLRGGFTAYNEYGKISLSWDQNNKLIADGDPIGSIIAWSGNVLASSGWDGVTNLPPGYVKLDGANINNNIYDKIKSLLTTVTGSTITNFPDLRGQHLRGSAKINESTWQANREEDGGVMSNLDAGNIDSYISRVSSYSFFNNDDIINTLVEYYYRTNESTAGFYNFNNSGKAITEKISNTDVEISSNEMPNKLTIMPVKSDKGSRNSGDNFSNEWFPLNPILYFERGLIWKDSNANTGNSKRTKARVEFIYSTIKNVNGANIQKNNIKENTNVNATNVIWIMKIF